MESMTLKSQCLNLFDRQLTDRGTRLATHRKISKLDDDLLEQVLDYSQRMLHIKLRRHVVERQVTNSFYLTMLETDYKLLHRRYTITHSDKFETSMDRTCVRGKVYLLYETVCTHCFKSGLECTCGRAKVELKMASCIWDKPDNSCPYQVMMIDISKDAKIHYKSCTIHEQDLFRSTFIHLVYKDDSELEVVEMC